MHICVYMYIYISMPFAELSRAPALRRGTHTTRPIIADCSVLSRKTQIGDKYTDIVHAVADVACAHDGSFTDNGRLSSLRCCNDLLALRNELGKLPGLHVQVAAGVEPLLNVFKSSAASPLDTIQNEWALFVRNVAAVLFCVQDPGTEVHVVACAGFALQIMRSAPPSASAMACNAVLALGTCALFSPEVGLQITAAGARVSRCAVLCFVLK